MVAMSRLTASTSARDRYRTLLSDIIPPFSIGIDL
jgi:hypothetical protein